MGQSDVADLLFVIEHEVPLVVVVEGVADDGGNLDDGPLDGDRDHVGDTGPPDAERDRFAGLALHQRDGSFQLPALGKLRRLLAVDFDDPVTGLDPGLVGGAAGQRRGHDQVGSDLDADPAELLADALLEPRDLLGADVVGVLVEFLEHAADGRFDQPPPVDALDVVPLDLFERLGEHPHQHQDFFLAGLGALFLGVAVGGHEHRVWDREDGQQHGHQCGDDS